MKFDEQGDSGFSDALGAPGRVNVTERALDGALAAPLEEMCVATRMHAPGLAWPGQHPCRFGGQGLQTALQPALHAGANRALCHIAPLDEHPSLNRGRP
jgi:hypothetical protein